MHVRVERVAIDRVLEGWQFRSPLAGPPLSKCAKHLGRRFCEERESQRQLGERSHGASLPRPTVCNRPAERRWRERLRGGRLAGGAPRELALRPRSDLAVTGLDRLPDTFAISAAIGVSKPDE